MTSDKFCLKWNEFENNISKAFVELRDIKEFLDVTLVCEDGQQVQTHKVILSACSPFFLNILQRNPHSHPLLYLKGVRYEDLRPLLNFMYCGEVNVSQDELNSFLSVAEDLQVKGLTQGTQTNTNNNSAAQVPHPAGHKRKIPSPLPPPKQMPDPYYVSTPQPAKKKAKFVYRPPQSPMVSSPDIEDNALTVNTDQHHIEIDDTPQSVDFAADEDEENIDDTTSFTDEAGYESATVDAANITALPSHNKEMLNLLVEEHMFKDPIGRYQCTLCDRSVRDKCDARRHIEAKHFPNLADYPCNKCSKSFRTLNGLKSHRHKDHKLVDNKNLKVPYLPLLHGNESAPALPVDPLALPNDGAVTGDGDMFVNELC